MKMSKKFLFKDYSDGVSYYRTNSAGRQAAQLKTHDCMRAEKERWQHAINLINDSIEIKRTRIKTQAINLALKGYELWFECSDEEYVAIQIVL